METPLDAPAPFFETTFRVRYEETDRMGKVYHGRYFEYFEIGRTEWFRALGTAYADLEAGGVFLVVVEAGARYLAPARYDDVLTVRTRLAEVKRATIDFSYEILREGVKLAEGRTLLAAVGRDGRPRRLPDEIGALRRRRPAVAGASPLEPTAP